MARNMYNVDETIKERFNLRLLLRLLKYIKPFKRQFAIAMILILSSIIVTQAIPLLVRQAFDVYIPNKDMEGLLFLSIFAVAFLIINTLCLSRRQVLIARIGHNIVRNIREDVFRHVQALSFNYFDSRPHGKILVRLVNYVNYMSDILSGGLITLFGDIVSLVVIVVIMFMLDAKLTLIAFMLLPILCISIIALSRFRKRAWQKVASKNSNINAYLSESLNGIKVIQNFNMQKSCENIFHTLNMDYRKIWYKAVFLNFLNWPAIENISLMSSFAVIFFTVFVFVNPETQIKAVSVGTLIAMLSYIGRFWGPINNMANFYNSLITASAYTEQIFDTLDEPVLVKNRAGAKKMPDINGKIEFKSVTFKYEDKEISEQLKTYDSSDKVILRNVSFTAEAGQVIALVGETGSGKTTIVNLIPRFYDIQEGTIEIDNIDIASVDLISLRSQIAIMLQDTFLFSGSIMENIRYGRLDATDDEIKNAASILGVSDIILSMENGFDHWLSESGNNLSLGQKQIISLVRAMIANPKILILDEATASIDSETEAVLQSGLKKLLHNKTTFIVAHRLSTIRSADMILYISQGEILERGTHDSLLEKRGAYWKQHQRYVNTQSA